MQSDNELDPGFPCDLISEAQDEGTQTSTENSEANASIDSFSLEEPATPVLRPMQVHHSDLLFHALDPLSLDDSDSEEEDDAAEAKDILEHSQIHIKSVRIAPDRTQRYVSTKSRLIKDFLESELGIS